MKIPKFNDEQGVRRRKNGYIAIDIFVERVVIWLWINPSTLNKLLIDSDLDHFLM